MTTAFEPESPSGPELPDSGHHRDGAHHLAARPCQDPVVQHDDRAQGKARTASALLVAGVVLAIPIGAALVGGTLLNLLGINLDAFSFVGGLIIFAMGIEMLYGGAPSRAQGGDTEKKVREEGANEEDEGLIIPLSIPHSSPPRVGSASAEAHAPPQCQTASGCQSGCTGR